VDLPKGGKAVADLVDGEVVIRTEPNIKSPSVVPRLRSRYSLSWAGA